MKIVRHGFTFWEAAPAPAPAPSPTHALSSRGRALAELLKIDFAAAAAEAEAAASIEARLHRYDPAIWGDLVQFSDEDPSKPSVRAIQEGVARVFGVTIAEFTSPSASARLAAARYASMAICRRHTELTDKEIAAAHNRATSSVWRAETFFNQQLGASSEFATKILAVESNLLPRQLAA